MIIEHLTVSIPDGTEAAFLKADAEVWTATLAAQPGYIGKETWVELGDRTRVHLTIRWQTRDEWKSVPGDLLAATDRRMTEVFGHAVPVLSCEEFEVIG
ncbi:MAG: TIGR03792 family protein [Pseudomonadota bacterium]